MSKTSTRKKELQRKVLYSLLAASVMSVCISGGDVWAADVDYGKVDATGGRRVIYVPLPDGVTVNNNDDAGTTTINGGSLTIDYDGLKYADAGAVQARADKAMDVYPELSITMQDALTVNSKFTAVTGQDGKVNLTSNNGDVIVSTSFTSNAGLETGTTATHLSNEAYAAVYARNLFAKDGVAGEVNISGKNVQVLTAKQTMTGAGMETVKYGTAISGNGNGAINIHATDTVVINGAIESLNTYLQKKSTTGIKVNINQDAADTAKVTMEGLFINAADKSEVNIKGAAGSSIKADLLASATPALMGSGGLINIDFADGGTVEGAITAQNSGVIKITGADITGSVTVDGGEYHGTDTSVTSSTDNLGTYAGAEKGAVIIKNNGKAVFGGTQTKITVNADHDGKVYGVVLDAGEAEFNADTTITVVNVTKTGPETGEAYAGVAASYALYAENGGKITVGSEGKTVSLTASGTKGGKVIGLNVTGGSDTTINGSKLTIDVSANVENGNSDDRIIGIDASANKGGKVTLNSDEITILGEQKGHTVYCDGVRANMSTIEFNGNTAIDLKADLQDNDKTNQFAGINVQCDGGDAHATTIAFNGDKTDIKLEGNASWFAAVQGSGGRGSINFTGDKVDITAINNKAASEGDSTTVGIYAQYGATINSSAATDIVATVQGNGYANGIYNTNNYGYNGNVKLNGSFTGIVTSNEKSAYGIYNDPLAEDSTGGTVLIGENLHLDVTAANGSAFGIYGEGKYSKTTALGNVTIKATGQNNTIALYVDKSAEITVGSEGKTVSLTGDVVAESSGRITLAGDINTVAGIVTADGGEVVLGGSEKATYTANKFVTANSGKITVSGGTLNIDNLSDTNKYKFALLDDSLVVTGNGVLKATSDNLFDKDNNVAIKDDVDKVVSFTGGKLAVSDATYTLADSTSYSKALKEADKKNAKTTIVMTGNLTDTNVTNEANVEVLAPTGAVHTNVTGEVSGNTLNVGGNAGADGTVSNVDNDLGVKDLQFKANADGAGNATINITDNNKLTLVGAGSGELLQGTNDSNIVNVGVTDTGAGTLTLGNMAAANSGGTLNADVNLQAGSKMNVETGNFTVQKIAAKEGTLAVNAGASLQTKGLSIGDSLEEKEGTVEAAGSLNVDELKINKGSIAVTGSLNAGTSLTATGSDAAITVGDAESAGTLTAVGVALNGASLMLDPVWKDNSTISTASKAGLEFANSHTVDGKLTVGQNSVLSLGTTDTAKAEAAFTATGLSWGQNDITAALYIDAAQTLDGTKGGGITVDGSLTHDSKSGMAEANTAHFANQSLLMVDSSLLSNKGALQATDGTLTVYSGAKLYIANAEADKNYIVVSGFGNGSAVKGWGADGLLLNKLVKVDAENTNFDSGTYTVATKKVSASEALPSVALPNILDAMKSDTDSAFAGVKYLSNAISDLNSDAQATAAVNGFAQGAENSGAAHSGTMAAFTIGDTIQSRMSLANAAAAPQGGKGKGADADDNGSIWAQYIHNKDKVDNLGGISYDGQYNGVIIGGDFVPTGKYHSGVAFSYGSGSSTGSVSKNDFDFWGLSYYGSIKNDDTKVIFDAGYSKTSNDIKGAVAIDSDTKVLTLGVKGEKLINNGHGTSYVPYAGLRYLNVDGGSYNGTIGGKVAAHYSNDKANIWMLPIGIGVHHETVTADGWKVRPMADIAYVWTFGDNNSAMDVTVPGVNAMDRLGYDIMDSGFFVGKLGLEAEKGDWTYGLGYAYQKGSHAQNNKFMVNVTYSF